MKFARTDLIARVEAEIARREAAVVKRNTENLEAYHQQRYEYVAATTDGWRELMNTIRRKLRTGEPMTYADVPDALRTRNINGGYIATFNHTPPTVAVAQVDGLRSLLELLKAVADDEVTVAALERAGMRVGDLFRGRP